jgi:hypothetical protein
MYKKFICLTFMLLILSITSTSMAELVAYYSMDEGAGTLVADGSGKGHAQLLVLRPGVPAMLVLLCSLALAAVVE